MWVLTGLLCCTGSEPLASERIHTGDGSACRAKQGVSLLRPHCAAARTPEGVPASEVHEGQLPEGVLLEAGVLPEARPRHTIVHWLPDVQGGGALCVGFVGVLSFRSVLGAVSEAFARTWERRRMTATIMSAEESVAWQRMPSRACESAA